MEEVKTKDKPWCVYIHTNKINNKVYIGITSQKPETRWGRDGKRYKENQPVFYNAIQKYGWDNFNHIIFAENLTKEEAVNIEIKLIALYKSNCKRYQNPAYGYNMTDGGEGTVGRICSDETRAKIRNAKSNISEETRRKISDAAKKQMEDPEMIKLLSLKKIGIYDGINNPMYGKRHTEEARKKISDAAKERFSDPENCPRYGTGRNVIQLSLNGEYIAEYISADEAQRKTGINRSSIRRCCDVNHQQKTAGGFKWLYKDLYSL